MNQRVQIIDGKLRADDPDCLLEWVVRRPNGEPTEIGYYAGPAYVSGNKLNVARGVHLDEFVVDSKPTPESVQRDAGYRHGMKQKRYIWPGKRADESADYAEGWRASWSERRRVEDNKKRWAEEDKQAGASKNRGNPDIRRKVGKRMLKPTKKNIWKNPGQELHFANLTDLYRAAVAATKRSDALDRESQALVDAGQSPDSAAIAKHTAYVAELKPWVDGQNWYAYNGEGSPLVRWPSAAKWFKPMRRANPARKSATKKRIGVKRNPMIDWNGYRIYQQTEAERRMREKEMKEAERNAQIRDALRWEEIQEDAAFRKRLARRETNPAPRRKTARRNPTWVEQHAADNAIYRKAVLAALASGLPWGRIVESKPFRDAMAASARIFPSWKQHQRVDAFHADLENAKHGVF